MSIIDSFSHNKVDRLRLATQYARSEFSLVIPN